MSNPLSNVFQFDYMTCVHERGRIVSTFLFYKQKRSVQHTARRPQSGPPGVSIRPARSPRNVKNLCVSDVFFQALKYAKTRFLWGLRPGPR